MLAARSQIIALLAATIVLTWEVRPVLAETTLSWKFKNGDKISYVIDVKQTTKMKSDKEVFDLTQTLLLDTTWTVLLTDGAQAHIGVTIDRLRFRADGKGAAKLPMPYEYDSQDKAELTDEAKKGLKRSFESTLGKAVGAEFRVKMDRWGTILDVNAPEEFVKALQTNNAWETAGFFGSTFTVEGIKRKLTSWIIAFPLEKGKTWAVPNPSTWPAREIYTYTFQGTDARDGAQLQKIAINAKATFPRTRKVAGDKITAQESWGTVYFDNQNGRLLEYTLRHRLSFESYVVGSKYGETDSETITTVKLGKGQADKKRK